MKITQTPLVILNFKTYIESTGEKALQLARALEEVSEETGISMVAAPQGADLWRLSQEVKIPVLAQRIDPVRCFEKQIIDDQGILKKSKIVFDTILTFVGAQNTR